MNPTPSNRPKRRKDPAQQRPTFSALTEAFLHQPEEAAWHAEKAGTGVFLHPAVRAAVTLLRLQTHADKLKDQATDTASPAQIRKLVAKAMSGLWACGDFPNLLVAAVLAKDVAFFQHLILILERTGPEDDLLRGELDAFDVDGLAISKAYRAVSERLILESLDSHPPTPLSRLAAVAEVRAKGRRKVRNPEVKEIDREISSNPAVSALAPQWDSEDNIDCRCRRIRAFCRRASLPLSDTRRTATPPRKFPNVRSSSK